MKRLSQQFYAIALSLTACLSLSFTTLAAQTNFVKYTGNPILPLGAPGAWDDTEASHAHVSFDGTSYQMWYSGAPQENTYRIGYATSPDGVNWTKDAANPVLNVGGAGTFDSIALWTPAVHFDGSRYELWYSGGLTISGIGYATSLDPVSWVRQSSNPVLVKGSSGAWDDNYAYLPVVIRNDSLYQMWYTGQSASGIVQTGHATSTDGMNWSKHPNNPVLSPGGSGEWDAGGASAGSVLFEGGQYHMWYFNWSNPISDIKIGYATSPDGINWTKHPDNPILQPGSGWDGKNVWFPRVIKDGHRYRMWYTGTLPGTTIDRLGYAEDFSNATHVDSIQLSRKTAPAVIGARPLYFSVYIANPHSENLTVRALIKKDDGSIMTSVNLEPGSNNQWRGEWAIPAEPGDYSVGVELNNITGGYLHNSFDWGIFEEFHLYALSHTFTQTAQIADGGDDARGYGVAVAPDGTVFLANGSDGLRAYRYDGASFSNTAHIDEGGDDGGASDVAVATDGTIFLANGGDGLRAYRYDGTSLTSTAHIDDGGGANGVAVASDGTIFLANAGDGLRAYRYDGKSLTNTAHILSSEVWARNVAVSSDGSTVFLANYSDGLRVYVYDGKSFTNTAHDSAFAYNVEIASDGTVFAVSRSDLRAYSYDGTALVRIAHTEDVGLPTNALALAPGGTIFLSIGWGDFLTKDNGLWAYTFDGVSFAKTAYAPSSYSEDVAVAPDGMVFNAARGSGLLAFTYSGTVTDVAHAPSPTPRQFDLFQNYPNPFNPATTIVFSLPQSSFVTVKVYNLLGKEVATVLAAHKPAGQHSVTFDASALASGLYYYTLTAGDFTQSRKMLLLR